MTAQATRIGTFVAALVVMLSAWDGAAQSLAGQWEPASLNAGRQAAPRLPLEAAGVGRRFSSSKRARRSSSGCADASR